MIADYRVCLDACVLANYSVCDLMLRLAESPRLYTPVFSSRILDEVRRTHVTKLGWPTTVADSFQNAVCNSFPEALVTGFENLIPAMKNQKKDRHVLAAAVRGEAELIATFNLKDFPREHLIPWDVEAAHPQDYLTVLFELKPELVILRLSEAARTHNQTPAERLAKLSVALPQFAETVATAMGWDFGPLQIK